MADANPTPKNLRICHTCEWYERHRGNDHIQIHPEGFLVVDSEGFCRRYPPVQVYALPSLDSEDRPDDGYSAGTLSLYFDGVPVGGEARCGEWQLRDGLHLHSLFPPREPTWARPKGSKLIHGWYEMQGGTLATVCGSIHHLRDRSRLVRHNPGRLVCARCKAIGEARGHTAPQP